MIPVTKARSKVIYDDERFTCQAFCKSAEKRDKGKQYEFIAFRDADPDDYLPYNKPNGALKAIILIDNKGRIFKGAKAISQVLGHIKKPWNILGWILALPLIRSLADIVYRILAYPRRNISNTN